MPARPASTPYVAIDLNVVERNIERVQKHFDGLGLAFRPHIKTHKIPELALRQLEAGACGINCQKIGEIEVMSAAGCKDILLTYNVLGAEKIERLAAVVGSGTKISVTVDHPIVAQGLSDAGLEIDVLVECDTGHRRCGVMEPAKAAELAAHIDGLPSLRFAGLMTFPPFGSIDAVDGFLAEAKDLCLQKGLDCAKVTTGGTPDIWQAGDYNCVNEYRAGTYIYNDLSLVEIGFCSRDDCALRIRATVVSANEPGRAVVDAGSKTLTTDTRGRSNYGEAADRPDIQVRALSEEHGILAYDPEHGELQVGDQLELIPNHACVVSNMMDEVWFHSGSDSQSGRWVQVAARGKVA